MSFQSKIVNSRPHLIHETFEKCSISFKIKAHENFNHRNISDISRIKIRMQHRNWADKRRLRKGAFCKGLNMIPCIWEFYPKLSGHDLQIEQFTTGKSIKDLTRLLASSSSCFLLLGVGPSYPVDIYIISSQK